MFDHLKELRQVLHRQIFVSHIAAPDLLLFLFSLHIASVKSFVG